MEGTLEELWRISNCPEGATFSQLGLRKSVALLSIVLIGFLLGGCGSQPTVTQTTSPERPHSDSFGKSDY
jgi:hypothetical protein